MHNIEFADRLAQMWRESRIEAGKSQDYVAKALGVSKKTVQNWEAGTASPNFRTALEWFECLGVPMYPYLMNLLYPDEMEKVHEQENAKNVKKALHRYIDELDDFHASELLYLFYGVHGSSPTGTIDVVNTYLHLPLAMRVCLTESVRTHYEIAEAKRWLGDADKLMPKIETLNKYIDTAKSAVLNGKDSYLRFSEEDI